jgi:hypothetical protein
MRVEIWSVHYDVYIKLNLKKQTIVVW